MLRAFPLPRLRSLLSAAALVFSLLGASVSFAGAVHAEGLFAPYEAALAQETMAIDLVNADRVANGLPALEFDPGLATVARWRSEDMAARQYFSHDIGGYQVFQVLRDHGITYRVAGENLA